MHQRMIGVCQNDMTSTLMQRHNHLCQLHMIFFVKLFLGIAFEIRILRGRQVWRVKENKVTRLCVMFQDQEVVSAQDLCLFQNLRRSSQTIFVADFGILIFSEGDIKPPLLIDSVQAIETSLIQKNRSCSSFCLRQRCPFKATDSIEHFAGIFVFL